MPPRPTEVAAVQTTSLRRRHTFVAHRFSDDRRQTESELFATHGHAMSAFALSELAPPTATIMAIRQQP